MPKARVRRRRSATIALPLRTQTRWLHRNGPGLLALLSLALGLTCLEIIGPPPAVRLDPLWVYERRNLVHMLIYAAGSAAGSTLLTLLVRRGRVVLALAWLGAALLSVNAYSDRLAIVARVVTDRLV